MRKLITFLLLLYSTVTFSEDRTSNTIFISIDSLDSYPNYLRNYWRYSDKDDSAMSQYAYDDSQWRIASPALNQTSRLSPAFNGIGWFRLHFIVDSTVVNLPLGLGISHLGASEIYADGKLIQTFGHIQGPDSSYYYDPLELPFVFTVQRTGEHVLAIRYANFKAKKNNETYRYPFQGFKIMLGIADRLIYQKDLKSSVFAFVLMLLSGIFLALSLLHLLMYFYYRQARSNLYFSIFMFCLALAFIISYILVGVHIVSIQLTSLYIINAVFCISCLSFSGFINELFAKRKLRFKIISASAVLIMILRFAGINFFGPATVALVIAVSLEAVFMIIYAMVKRMRGARIIGTGILFFALFILTILAIALPQDGVMNLNDSTLMGEILIVFLALAILSIPISMSVYQAWSFARMHKDLGTQLEQVKLLSEKALEQEQEKQKLLANRQEELEKEVALRTSELKQSHLQLIQQEKLASLGQLTAGIAHEIKNPLNFVTNFSDLNAELIDEIETATSETERKQILSDLKKNLGKISHHSKRADSIVKNMLEHSRGNGGEKQWTDINQLGEEFFDLAYHGMRAILPDFSCEMKKNFAIGIPKVNIVPQDISRVFLNLLNNAFYAVRERSMKSKKLKY